MRRITIHRQARNQNGVNQYYLVLNDHGIEEARRTESQGHLIKNESMTKIPVRWNRWKANVQ